MVYRNEDGECAHEKKWHTTELIHVCAVCECVVGMRHGGKLCAAAGFNIQHKMYKHTIRTTTNQK